jgi:nucleotide-binding universal stress UspA family protein
MYRSILVPIDLDHGALGVRIVQLARAIGGPEARVTALHVLDPIPPYVAAQISKDMMEAHRTQMLGALQKLLDESGTHAEAVLRRGAPAQEILDMAAELNSDLIVIGSHKPGLRDYMIGSTAARVVRHAACSVLIDRA